MWPLLSFRIAHRNLTNFTYQTKHLKEPDHKLNRRTSLISKTLLRACRLRCQYFATQSHFLLATEAHVKKDFRQ